MNAITTNTANIETSAAGNGLTITVKPYGVTVKVGNTGYVTDATICKFNDSRHLAAALLTNGVKLAAKPHLITTRQNANMGVAYFFHQLDKLMAQGLSGVLLGDGVAPHIPEGLWEKKAWREMENAKRREMNAKRREVKWVRRAKTTAEMDSVESDQPEVKPMPVEVPKPMPVEVPKPMPVEVPKPMPVEVPKPMPVEVQYAEGHIKMCQRRLTAALRQKTEQKDYLDSLLSYIALMLEVPSSIAKVLATAIIGEKVTPQTLDAMKELRRLNPKFLNILTETHAVFQQELTPENIGEDETELVDALKGLGYTDEELTSLLDTLIEVLTAM